MKRDLIGVFAAVCFGETAVCAMPLTRPNFVIIFTDDQGYQDLGCFESPDIKMSRIDQMAQEGMRFTDFYAQTVCGSATALKWTSPGKTVRSLRPPFGRGSAIHSSSVMKLKPSQRSSPRAIASPGTENKRKSHDTT